MGAWCCGGIPRVRIEGSQVVTVVGRTWVTFDEPQLVQLAAGKTVSNCTFTLQPSGKWLELTLASGSGSHLVAVNTLGSIYTSTAEAKHGLGMYHVKIITTGPNWETWISKPMTASEVGALLNPLKGIKSML